MSRRIGSGLRSDPNNVDAVRETPTSDVKIEYQLDNHISVIGMWENRERHLSEAIETSGTDTNIESENILGLDLKYEIEF